MIICEQKNTTLTIEKLESHMTQKVCYVGEKYFQNEEGNFCEV